jgi:hypothetical protein
MRRRILNIEHEPVEGSHLYRINGKYCMFSPAAGIGSQLCVRFDHIYGLYEKKVVGTIPATPAMAFIRAAWRS